MPASSSETRSRWRKRKREHPATRKSKLKEPDNDDMFDDNEEDDDPDMDPPQNQPETDDNPHNQNADRTAHILRERESEKLVDGGVKISEFPVVVKRVISRPHSLVLGIVEAERAAYNGVSRSQGQGVTPFLENVSYGQLQALSDVPKDCPAFLGEETASGSGGGSYVIVPPGIVPGSGITKRFGSAGRVHVVPVHADWFSPNCVHRLERQVVPHFFSGKSVDHTPEKYMECRNFIVAKYMENPEKHLSVSDCEGLVGGIDNDDLTRIVRFLDHWGIINYCATPLDHGSKKEGTYLYEDSNGELCVPSAALKSVDSLILFDKPKCRLKATDAYTELARRNDEDQDLDSTIREMLSEHRCNYCSRSIPTVYYQSDKEVDAMLCLDCFNEGRFVAGHSSVDFVKVSSIKDYGDVDGDDWTDQETLLLLEGMQLYGENWDKIALHVGSKSKAQCILHFVRLPLDGFPLEIIDVPSTSGSSSLLSQDDYRRSQLNSNGNSNTAGISRQILSLCTFQHFNPSAFAFCCDVGCSLEAGNSTGKFPFADSGNPVMNLVAFLASALGPRVAAACAHASLGALCKDSASEESPCGETMSSVKREAVPLPADSVRTAAKAGLAAAATKAKLFADHEEREIQRLSANIVNHQMKRLELKLKQFAEVETLLMRECEQMERTRQRIAAERAIMTSAQFSPAGTSRTVSPQTVATGVLNNPSGNSRPQVLGSQQPLIPGYGNNQPAHPHMSLIQQHGMYGLGPRLPLSAIHPSSSSSGANAAMFSPRTNTQPSLGPTIPRSLSGSKSSLG